MVQIVRRRRNPSKTTSPETTRPMKLGPDARRRNYLQVKHLAAVSVSNAMVRRVVLAAVASAALGVIGSASASGPTLAQIKAAIATHSDNFVLANSFTRGGHAPGHGWIDVKTGAGRWVSATGKLLELRSVAPDPHDPALVVVTDTYIDYATRTWYRAKRDESTKTARPKIVDPLATAPKGVEFRLLGEESVDGRQTYHLRSTYFPELGVRLDIWFSTDQYYLIRFTHTTRDGKVIQRIDNRWLPRTSANLALLTMAIPSGFKQVFVSP
jgi:hypothetical protein